MSSQHLEETDLSPNLKKRLLRMDRVTKRAEHFLLHALHQIELVIASLTVVALLVALAYEIYLMFGVGYFTDISSYLHHILTIVVGLEFVRMLIDTTPANILEVLTLAITRHVILSHDEPLSNMACIACVAGLFAIRRFLIRSHELKKEMVEND